MGISRALSNGQKIWHCRLCWLVTLSVFASIIIIEAIILAPSFINYERDRLLALNYAGQQAVRAAVSNSNGHTDTARLETLVSATLVEGIVLHANPSIQYGTDLQTEPEGSDNLRALRRIGNGDWMEVHWTADELHLPFAVSARLNTQTVRHELTAFVWRIVGLILLITFFVTVTTMLVLNSVVLGPIRRLKSRLLAAGNDPDHPLTYLSNHQRRDELGQIFRALDVMLEHSDTHLRSLHQMNEKLDNRVAQRTRALAQRNTQLLQRIEERDQAENKALMMSRFPDENTNPVMRVDQNGRLLYANVAAQPILDCWHTTAEGKAPAHIIDLIAMALKQTRVQSFEEPCQLQHFLIHIRPVEDGLVNLYGLDISDRKQYEEELRHRTWHDELTDLPNQAALEQRIDQTAGSGQAEFALLMLGLNDFHTLNMTAGRAGGDQVLRAAADRLRQQLPSHALLARLRGDIFGVVLSTASVTDIAMISTVARRLIQALQPPFEIDGESYLTGASIGVAIAPTDGNDADTLLRHAEMAMLRAKAKRRHDQNEPVAYFKPELSARMAWRQVRLQGLRKALADNELCLHYQLQISAGSEKVAGVEALVRWQHPVEGLISPGEFIPLAEETGLIVPLGRWVMGEACRQAAAWHREGHDIRMAVNLSAQHLLTSGLTDEVEALLDQHALPANLLELEITESAVIEDIERTVVVLQRLASLGVTLAVDDFGTGYSSLAYLKRLPVHRVKIDQMFVRELPANEHDATLCRAIIGLAHNLGYDVIAEGVETQSQVEWLAAQGCDELQGFYFAKPQPPAAITWPNRKA